MVLIIKKFPNIINRYQKNIEIYKNDVKTLKSLSFFKNYHNDLDSHIMQYSKLKYNKVYELYNIIEKKYKNDNYIFLPINWDNIMLNIRVINVITNILKKDFNICTTSQFNQLIKNIIIPRSKSIQKITKTMNNFFKKIIKKYPTKKIVTLSCIAYPFDTYLFEHFMDKNEWKDIMQRTIVFSSTTKYMNKHKINILPYFINVAGLGTNSKKEQILYFKGTYNTLDQLQPKREEMYNILKNTKNSKIILMDNKSKFTRNDYIKMMNTSKYILCPFGQEDSSFRLYEAIKSKSIPIYIYDIQPSLPFTDVINWKKVCILVKYDDIKTIPLIIKQINEKDYKKFIEYGQKILNNYFTIEGCSRHIMKILDSNKYKLSFDIDKKINFTPIIERNGVPFLSKKISPTMSFSWDKYFTDKKNFIFYKNNLPKKIGKPNILVIMLLFGNDYTQLVKPCVVRKIEYCKKNNYNLLICKENLLDFMNISLKKKYYFIWSKIIMSYFVLRHYDWIWVTDADTYINNLSIRIENYIDNDYNFIINSENHIDIKHESRLSDEYFWKSLFKNKKFIQYDRISSSDFLLKNCEWSERLLMETFNCKHLLDNAIKNNNIQLKKDIQYKFFKDLHEQAYLNYLINVSKFYNSKTKILKKDNRISIWIEEYFVKNRDLNLRKFFSVDFQGTRGDVLNKLINIFDNKSNKVITINQIDKVMKKTDYCKDREEWFKKKIWGGKYNPTGWTFDNNKSYDRLVLFPTWCKSGNEKVYSNKDIFGELYDQIKKT